MGDNKFLALLGRPLWQWIVATLVLSTLLSVPVLNYLVFILWVPVFAWTVVYFSWRLLGFFFHFMLPAWFDGFERRH